MENISFVQPTNLKEYDEMKNGKIVDLEEDYHARIKQDGKVFRATIYFCGDKEYCAYEGSPFFHVLDCFSFEDAVFKCKKAMELIRIICNYSYDLNKLGYLLSKI